ncbi:actin-binding protein WASF1-like [Eriocheir sinensis]|uniref:actin-binding protein WASF1-like n=1 Tax=Eriocheir sinensis TaxID=95602 RepID=UPI0021C8F668|nr:actin-binding protein WASF1-like [Eriocheir sinensis]
MEMKNDAPPTSLYRVSGTNGYEFEYKVVDSKAAWVHSRDEWSDGQSTRGSYTVKLPDGRIQKVTFTADENGYHPIITYEHADEDGDGGGGEGGGGGGGVGAIPDWIGASRGNWYTAPHTLGVSSDLRNIGHPEKELKGSGEGVIFQPHFHDPWGPTPLPHHLYGPLRLNEQDISLYDLPYLYEYHYQPPPPLLPPPPPPSPRRDPHSHLYKAPMSEESSEEGGDDYGVSLYSKMKRFKPKSAINVREKPKTYLADGRKDLDEAQSMDSDEQSYEKKTSDTRRLVNNHKKENIKYDSGDEVEESSEHMMEKSDGYDMKKDLDDDKMKYEKSEEVEMDRKMEKTDTREYGKFHTMSAQHKDMDEYLRKIKRVIARFEKPRPPSHHHHQDNHHALYRQDTTRMVTPRKWIPKKASVADPSEHDSSDLEGRPRQIDVKMTPPDKPFDKPSKMDVKMTPPDKPFFKPSKMDVKMTPPDKPFFKPSKMDVKMTPPDKPFNTQNRMEFRMTPQNKPSLKPVVKVLHNPSKMRVTMTPPDKPFYIQKHRPPSPPPSTPPPPPRPPPPPTTTLIRKHSLQTKHQKGLRDFILSTYAPMLHAPPPTTPRHIIPSSLAHHRSRLLAHS